MSAFTIWKLAQVLCERLREGGSSALPDRWRAIAQRLRPLEMYERPLVLRTLVSGQAELDEMVSTLAIPVPGPVALEMVKTAAADPAPPAEGGWGVAMRAAADIQTMPVKWLWEPRVPLGALSLLAGDPKLGKSFVTLNLAATISRGAPLPGDDGYHEPCSVVLMSAEDDPGRTIVPRLKAAGADLSKVHILDAVVQEDGSHALPRLRCDIDHIGLAVMALGDCRLVVIDPVSAYLGGVDDYRNAELRGVLSPLKQLAEDLDLAVVLVSHLNKGASLNGQYRVAGSVAYVGACRANFLFLRDRRDPSGRRVLMLDNGCNLTASVPTLAYQIQDRGDGPVVAWEAEPLAITTEDALRASADVPNDSGQARACEQWLRQRLSTGAVPVAELLSGGREAGFSKDQLKRAKKRIGAATKREGFGPTATRAWVLNAVGVEP